MNSGIDSTVMKFSFALFSSAESFSGSEFSKPRYSYWAWANSIRAEQASRDFFCFSMEGTKDDVHIRPVSG